MGWQIRTLVRFKKYTENLSIDLPFVDVALGSKVAIRHVNTQGGYLHSHPHNYPGGSKRAWL